MHIAELLENEEVLRAGARRLLKAPHSEFPILISKIKLTWRCNLRCEFCNVRVRSGDSETAPQLEAGIVKKSLLTLHDAGVRKVHLSGGEALLYNRLEELLEAATALGFQVNLTTNGTLINKETARLIINSRIHAVNVSIDSDREKQHDEMRGKKGAWKSAWKGIALLMDKGGKKGRCPVVGVNTVVTRRNAEHLDLLYSLLKENNIDRWLLLPVDSEDKKVRPTKEQWNEIAEKIPGWGDIIARMPFYYGTENSVAQAGKGRYAGGFYKKNICFAPWFSIFIDADGCVLPCCMGRRDIPPFGNINETPLEEILRGAARKEILSHFAAGGRFPICDNCDDFIEENIAFGRLYDGY